jgi:hypothetical protein
MKNNAYKKRQLAVNLQKKSGVRKQKTTNKKSAAVLTTPPVL